MVPEDSVSPQPFKSSLPTVAMPKDCQSRRGEAREGGKEGSVRAFSVTAQIQAQS